MTEEQFAAEVRFLAAAKLFELGKLSSRPQPWPGSDGWSFSINLEPMASMPSICMMNRSKPNSTPHEGREVYIPRAVAEKIAKKPDAAV